MSLDISKLLGDWRFDPNGAAVRIVKGDDGRDKLQVRLELGLLQMELDGRPDGEKIEQFGSWFEYYQNKQKTNDSANPDGKPFRLETEDCARLLREGAQYYQRHMSFWRLERYELCARDTARNLKLFAFVREYARRAGDKEQFEQWRPSVTMMHARAVGTPLAELGDYTAALGVVDAGIAAIRQYLEDYNQSENAKECGELNSLLTWRVELEARASGDTSTFEQQAPTADQLGAEQLSRLSQLQEELELAIREERFEDAARLRDEIRRSSPGTARPQGE